MGRLLSWADGFDPDGAAGASGGLYGLPCPLDEAAVRVIGVPFEATTSYGGGTSAAPRRILEASTQVDLHDLWLDPPDPWRHGIAMLPLDPALEQLNERACSLARTGSPADLAQVNAIGEQVNDWVMQRTAEVLDAGAIPAIVGGDHSVSFGAIAAAARHVPGLGILHIDAHADLRDAYEGFVWSHASIFHNVLERVPQVGPIVQIGLRDIGHAEAARITATEGLSAVTDREIARRLAEGEPFATIASEAIAPLPDRVWVSFDIDGLDPSLCPATGTPVPGGLTFHQALLLLDVLAKHSRIVGFDLVEVGDAEWDANVGARLLYKLAGLSLASAGKQ
ncbi:MAG: agmatinase family protein [Myxococcales bacterium]|nr:agmatinase family protein [Myxococcales bacterium]